MTTPIEVILSQLVSINRSLDTIETATNELKTLLESGNVNDILSENLNYHNTLLDVVTKVKDLVSDSRSNAPTLRIGESCAVIRLRNDCD